MMRIKVLCIGNGLVADDAIGPYIFEQLRYEHWASKIHLKMLGVGGLDLLSEFEGEDLVVVVDATHTGKASGAITVVPWEEIEKVAGAPVTSHDIGLDEVMKVGRLLYPNTVPKKMTFIGIEGEDFQSVGKPLTRSVQAAVPEVLSIIREVVELENPVCYEPAMARQLYASQCD